MLRNGRLSIEGDGNKYPPWGFAGGREGTPGQVILDAGTADEKHLPSKMTNRPLRAGQRIRMVGPCGGGWGDPLERDAQQVRADVLDDVVSPGSAEELYGVILDEDLLLDEVATTQLRESRRVCGEEGEARA